MRNLSQDESKRQAGCISNMCFHFMSLQIAAAGFKNWPLTDSSRIVLESKLNLTRAISHNKVGECRKPSASTTGDAPQPNAPVRRGIFSQVEKTELINFT
jgi:hypothetical protein